jgi:hypothetical protein
MRGLRPASSVEELADGVRYTFPSRRGTFRTIFLTIWLVGWTVGELTAIWEVWNNESAGIHLKLWLIAWTFGGLAAMYQLLAFVSGKEIVTISPGTLTIQRDISGWEKPRSYDFTDVRNLRVSRPEEDFFWSNRRPGPFQNGTIAFNYKSKTISFGAGLDQNEARLVIADFARHGISSAAIT